MPLYLITLHAYRSWNADNPRGYVRTGQGILPPDPLMARLYNQRAKHEPARFTADLHSTIIDGCRDICQRRGWMLHHVVVVSSHLHALVSWRDPRTDWRSVRDTIKRILGWMLAKHTDIAGRPWFARKGSRKRVRDHAHFHHLMSRYLPDHTRGRRGGNGWSNTTGHYGQSPRVATL